MSGWHRKISKMLRFAFPGLASLRVERDIRNSRLFTRNFYLSSNPHLRWLFRLFPLRHYVVFGEVSGLFPNKGFDPKAYDRLNPDVRESTFSPFQHYVLHGRFEKRITLDPTPVPRGLPVPPIAPVWEDMPLREFAVVIHLYYPDLWPEIEAAVLSTGMSLDVYVTLSDDQTCDPATRNHILSAFPHARILVMPNHGRDVFPFVHLVNSGGLSNYRAICKIHTKRSPHLSNGDHWRAQSFAGLLPGERTDAVLKRFLSLPETSLWTPNRMILKGGRWWGQNEVRTREILLPHSIPVGCEDLSFPAGSMYWIKPELIERIRNLTLSHQDFEQERGQLDGTTAHAFERAIGYLAVQEDQRMVELQELEDHGSGRRYRSSSRPHSFLTVRSSLPSRVFRNLKIVPRATAFEPEAQKW